MHRVAGDLLALGVDVRVDLGDEVVDLGGAVGGEGVVDGLLADEAVLDVPVDDLVRVLDEAAVAGRDRAQALDGADAGQRVEVGGHVAVGRADDDGGAVHDVVAGEEHALLGQVVAEVVRRVARRVHGLEPELGGVDGVALADATIDLEAVAVAERHHLGAGALLEAGGAGRVVRVGVGAHDPADAIAAAPDDGVEVGVVVGTGIDDHDLVDADQVGVGARPGEHARVRRQDAPSERAERLGDAGDELLDDRLVLVAVLGGDRRASTGHRPPPGRWAPRQTGRMRRRLSRAPPGR